MVPVSGTQQFSLRVPSGWFHTFMALHALVGGVILAFVDAFGWARLLAMLLVVVSGVRHLCIWRVWRQITGIRLREGCIFLVTGGAWETEVPIVLQEVVVVRFLVAFTYRKRLGSGFLSLPLVIFPQSMPESDFRHLRIAMNQLRAPAFKACHGGQ